MLSGVRLPLLLPVPDFLGLASYVYEDPVKSAANAQKTFVCLARNFGKGFVCRDLRDPPPPSMLYVVMVNSRNAAFAEERAEVEVLFAEAKKFQELEKKMRASMERMETSGQILQEAMGPVYSNTQPLHVINDSMLKLLPLSDQD